MAIQNVLQALSDTKTSAESARLKQQPTYAKNPVQGPGLGYYGDYIINGKPSVGPVKQPAAPAGSGGQVLGANTTNTQNNNNNKTTTTTQNKPTTPSVTRDQAGLIAGGMGAADFLSSQQLDDIYNRNRDNASNLATDIENTARANAEGEYSAIMDALKTKKGEVTNLGEQQKASVDKELGLGLEDLAAKQDTETKNIDKQKTQFQADTQQQNEDLGKQWRDTSLEVQRIMRARGVSESGFATGKETDLLMNFNKGLGMLAQKSSDALKSFADAATETVNFYTREKEKLQVTADDQKASIDTWVRQQVQDIQSQEGIALSQKLSQVRDAVLQGRQLKANVEQKIADQQLGLATYTYQMQQQYKYAVATAALGKVQTAQDQIKQASDLFNLTSTILKNGGSIVQTKNKDGTDAFAVHGINPATGSAIDIPVTAGYVQGQALDAAKQTKGLYDSGLAPDPNVLLTQAYQGMGLNGNPFQSNQQTPAAQPSIWDRLTGLFQ